MIFIQVCRRSYMGGGLWRNEWLNVTQLANLLAAAEKAHATIAPDKPWAEWYARWILQPKEEGEWKSGDQS